MDPHPASHEPATGVLHLASWGLIAARGPEAGTFLQGQLTQDVVSMGEHESRLAGYCSAKGRLLATFVVMRGGPDEWWLACSADLLASTLKRLSMFVLRAKCKLSDAGAEHRLWGLVGSAATAAMARHGGAVGAAPAPGGVLRGEGRIVVRLPDAAGVVRALLLQPVRDPAPEGTELPAQAWEAWEVRSAVPRVQARTVELFVPQMVNLELVGGVSFQKGCYPGQEVVARSQYRGTLKRRAFLYTAPAAAAPGDPIFAADDPGQPAGAVVLAAPAPGQPGAWELMAETKIAAAHGSVLHLGSPEGPPLRPLPLPYPLPAQD